MSKYVNIECGGENHVLQFNRFAIKKIESLGFSIEQVNSKLITTIELLFLGALIKSKPMITIKESNKILDAVLEEYDTSELLDVLIDLFMDAVPVIGDDSTEEELASKKKLVVQRK